MFPKFVIETKTTRIPRMQGVHSAEENAKREV